MGCLNSALTKEEQDALKQSAIWDKKLLIDNQEEEKKVKLLFLGTGESGKSTIFKQMQILYANGFTEKELGLFQPVVRRNIVESMQTLIQGRNLFKFDLENEGSIEAEKFLLTLDPLAFDFWDDSIVPAIDQLWLREPAIKKTFKKRSKLQLLDSAEYLFDNINRIGDSDYVPEDQDILRARLRTSGIVKKTIDIKGFAFTFIDVGGQRNERRKWIHCFDSVTALIFVAAISEYDQVLYEDEEVNRLKEAIVVFEKYSNHDSFFQTAMILFLNKTDLFRKKLLLSPFDETFKTFQGDPKSFDDTTKFIEQKFLEVIEEEKMVFTHLTCATNTENVKYVFEACQSVILEQSIQGIGLL